MALYTVNDGAVISPADVNQFTNLLNGTTSGTQITNAGRIRAQLAGAATGTGGYVGETPSLTAPTSGTFVAGDFASDANGLIWVCKAAGSPGTWSALPTQVFATRVLGSPAASTTFTSIPAFTRLQLMWRARPTAGAVQLNVRIDGDVTAGHYVWSKVSGRTAAASATDGGTSATAMSIGLVAGTTANYFSSGVVTIEGWNQATGFASASGTSSAWDTNTSYWAETYAAEYVGAVGPHTSLTILPASANMDTGSQFTLIGYM